MSAKNMSVNLHSLTTKRNMLLTDITAFALGKAYCHTGGLQHEASGQCCNFIHLRAKKKKP